MLVCCLAITENSNALMQKSETFYQKVRQQITGEIEEQNDSSIIAVIRLDYDSLDVVPPEIKKTTAIDKTLLPNKGISVYVSLTNDFNFLRVVGLKNKADDFGETHGTNAAVSGYLPNGLQLTFDASTKLYTKPIEGTVKKINSGEFSVDQYFTNENMIRFVLDNIKANKAYYWKAEMGWQQLSSVLTTDLSSASRQQEVFHDIVNQINPGSTKKPIYVANGKGIRDGYFVGLYLGLASKQLQMFKVCQSHIYADLGGRASELNHASFVETNEGAVLACSVGKKRMYYRLDIGNRSRAHSSGYQYTPYLDFSVGKKWQYGVRIEQSAGDLINYMDYNLPNVNDGSIDPIYTFYILRNGDY